MTLSEETKCYVDHRTNQLSKDIKDILQTLEDLKKENEKSIFTPLKYVAIIIAITIAIAKKKCS